MADAASAGYVPSCLSRTTLPVAIGSPRARYRVLNWPGYEAGLHRRGKRDVLADEAMFAGWFAPRRTTPGGQPLYSDLAIEHVLTLRLVFHLALRQAECLIPWFDGAVFTCEWKEALWARFSMAAPQRQRQSVERYSIVKRA